MGEVRTRRLVASGLVMLLVLLVPVSADESSNLRLDLEIVDENSKPWYGTGDTVVLASSIINDGEATSVNEDPSCGTVMSITNEMGETIVDGTQTCRGQNRGLDVPSGATSLDTLSWALDDQNGVPVPPGVYLLTVELSGSGLSSSVEVMVQQEANLPDALVYSTSLSHRGEALEAGQPFVITYEVYNPSAEVIDLSTFSSCNLLIEFDVPALGPTCTAGFDLIEPYAFTSLGHTMFQAQVGLSTLSIQTPDGELIDTYEFNTVDDEIQQGVLEPSIDLPSVQYSEGLFLDGAITLNNPLDESELLRFTNTCRANYWVADASGNVVFDSLEDAMCRDVVLDVIVGADSQTTFPLDTWAFVDELGCSILTGDYVLVAEVNEFGYAASKDISYNRISPSGCGFDKEIDVSLIIEEKQNSDVAFGVQLTGIEDSTEIQWIDKCKVSFEIWDLDLAESVAIGQDLCVSTDFENQAVRLNSDASITYQLQDFNEYAFSESNYLVYVELWTDRTLTASIDFSWPLKEQVSPESNSNSQESLIGDQTLLLSGIWSGFLTPDGTCWMIEDEAGSIFMLSDSTVPAWLPQRGTYGVYEGTLAEANAPCARFTAESFVLANIVEERLPVVEEPVVEESAIVEEMQEEEEVYPEWVPQAVAVLTVSAVLSMLGFAAFNNEAIRITTTLAGLWLLGLVGKTSETNDGRFQRGRLLGYLTANPGCHFRALLSALEMSNGQLSHHLRVLEQEESIWRRKDGRLVRYYPLTNTLHPLLEDDVLPVPILAPDPLSLQGKILLLLDHDSQMGDFPTQAELSKRLEKSQQLISHHLRTLEKYGLIEGRRMGMRNRYKLTKEALFLLETSDAYLQNEINL